MSVLRLSSSYDPGKIPAQVALRKSKADLLGFGGAMGGGKTRALAELAFDWALNHPSLYLPIFRNVHTHITDTTRRTFFEQVLPKELRNRKDLIRVKRSGGEDFIEFLWNGSQIHFVGLDDPGRVFSAEFGAAMVDEAHEVSEEHVLLINSRMRQRCVECLAEQKYDLAGEMIDCTHYPNRMVFGFNPMFPGHWLDNWFRQQASPTEYGFWKDEVFPTDADSSIGSAEFFIAKATDNPFLPRRYISQNLAGMSRPMRKRYLEGQWIHISGHGFFDEDALSALQEHQQVKPVIGELAGDLTGEDAKDLPRMLERHVGRLQAFRPPVRAHVTKAGEEVRAHRYIIGGDASTGAAADYSGIQVLDVDTFEQVAEWQGKTDPDTLGEMMFLLGCIYNGATLAPEVNTFGFGTMKRIQKLVAGWKGPAAAKPKVFTRPATTRLSTRFTDLLGWQTEQTSRALMLTTLEALVREGGLVIHGTRTIAELAAFAFPKVKPGMDYRPPRAESGAHDDLVIALAIAATIAERMPRQVSRPPVREERIAFSAAGM